MLKSTTLSLIPPARGGKFLILGTLKSTKSGVKLDLTKYMINVEWGLIPLNLVDIKPEVTTYDRIKQCSNRHINNP